MRIEEEHRWCLIAPLIFLLPLLSRDRVLGDVPPRHLKPLRRVRAPDPLPNLRGDQLIHRVLSRMQLVGSCSTPRNTLDKSVV